MSGRKRSQKGLVATVALLRALIRAPLFVLTWKTAVQVKVFDCTQSTPLYVSPLVMYSLNMRKLFAYHYPFGFQKYLFGSYG